MSSQQPPAVPPPFGPVPSPDPQPQPQPQPPSPPWWKNSTIIAALVPTLVFGGIAVQQGCRATNAAEQSADADQDSKKRAMQDDTDKKKIARGPSVSVTRGESPVIPSAFAMAEEQVYIGPIAKTTDWSETFNNWLASKSARPIGLYSTRVTVKALKDETTIIQDFKLKDRNCPYEVYEIPESPDKPFYDETIVYPPPMGGSGEDVTRTVIGFEVSQYDATKARFVERGDPRLGNMKKRSNTRLALTDDFSTQTVVLEQNDARTFDIYFGSNLDCTFRLEMNVTSGGSDEWIEIPIEPAWGKGKGAAIAAPYDKYGTFVKPSPDGNGMEFSNPTSEAFAPAINFSTVDPYP
ncbi:hypothetical protein [Streptomyces sp. NPDC092952]|uniref:hypothetical protein n=1 Tax=Streptomyces sp. NPDC092952 TaxID=3366018 RepID=UPI00381CA605